MRGIFLVGALGALCAQANVARPREAVPGEFIVKKRANLALSLAADNLEARGLRVHDVLSQSRGVMLVRAQSRAELEALPDVEYAEPNYIYYASFGSKPPPRPTPPAPPTPPPAPPTPPTPPSPPALQPVRSNDPMFSQLWGILNAGKDAAVALAWNLSKGSRDVIVAIIDTGIDYNHPDLRANIWENPQKRGTYGFNAITGSHDPMDDNRHGTHVAGTIGAVGDNNTGVVGVAPNVRLMGVKFLSGSGSGSLSDAIKAIDFARTNGAKIMNNSWGGGGFSQTLQEAIERASSAGIVFVAAAGNEENDNDIDPSYPASYPVANVVSVASSTRSDGVSSFSNFGERSVHLMAPGSDIMSTTPGNSYASLSGTSMATPHVSGAVALLLSREPSLTPAQVKQRLLDSADRIAAASGKVQSGRLNTYNLLANVKGSAR